MLPRIVCCAFLGFVALQSAFAFDNIEADVFYDREVRQPIMDEYLFAMKRLKAQAEGLGVRMRQKDVDTLRKHMYEKAVLMAQCFDQAMTLKKKTSKQILVDKHVKSCMEAHLKLMDTHGQSMTLGCSESQPITRLQENPPYDFLGFTRNIYGEEGLTSITTLTSLPDYIGRKKCLDNCEEMKKNPYQAMANDPGEYLRCERERRR